MVIRNIQLRKYREEKHAKEKLERDGPPVAKEPEEPPVEEEKVPETKPGKKGAKEEIVIEKTEA